MDDMITHRLPLKRYGQGIPAGHGRTRVDQGDHQTPRSGRGVSGEKEARRIG